MDDQPPRLPDAGTAPAKREVTLREDPTELVWVEWYTAPAGNFTRILSEQEGDELVVLAADSNELSQLLDALDPEKHTRMARDMGAFERVSVERSDGFVTLAVEELGEVTRMLILDDDEVEKLIGAVERAEAELPRTGDDPHV